MGAAERALAGRPGESIAELRAASTKDPNDTRSLLRLAELEAKEGHFAIACETYRGAGEVCVTQGLARRALTSFTQALAVAREGALVDRVAPIARAVGKLSVSEGLIREAVTTLDGAARWLIELGFDSHALPLLEARIEIEDSDIARVRLAETLSRIGEPARAADELVAVFGRLLAAGRRNEALDVAERLLGKRRDPAIARASAELYLERNRPGDPFLALAKLRICCDDDPTHVPTLELLARAFDLAGHGDKATRVRGEIGFLAHEDGDRARADVERRIDPARPSFWAVDQAPAPDESGSVVSVSINDVELVDIARPRSGERPASLLETALECIESLIAQGRYDEASVLVVRQLSVRPRNPLLLERKAEIEEMQNALRERPLPRLPGFTPRKVDGERSVSTGTRSVQAS